MEQQEISRACPGCGLADGETECQRLYQEVTVRLWSEPAYGAAGRLLHDTYCIQHEERYCGRPKGLAAHLGGVCWAVEYSGRPTGYQALQQWLDRVPWHNVPYPPEPGIPSFRGALTIADVHRTMSAALDIDIFAHIVQQYGQSAWDAYASLQPLARGWIEEALASTSRRRH